MRLMSAPKIETDFNGFLADDLLCLAHCEAPLDHAGCEIQLFPGQYVIAFSSDSVDDDGQPECLVASGLVEPSPSFAAHRGSVWSLRVDSRGVRYLSSLDKAD